MDPNKINCHLIIFVVKMLKCHTTLLFKEGTTLFENLLFFLKRALLFFEKQRQHNSKVLKKMHYFKSKQEGKENAYPSVELAKNLLPRKKIRLLVPWCTILTNLIPD